MGDIVTSGIVALEAWRKGDAWLCWAGLRNVNGVFELCHSDQVDVVLKVVEAVAVNGDNYDAELAHPVQREMKRVPQTFVTESAMRKMIRRRVHADLGGKDGWQPVYGGNLCLDGLAGRDTVSQFGKTVENKTVEVPDSQPAFDDDDNSFAARRRRKKALKAKASAVEEQKKTLKAAGQVHVRAYHPGTGVGSVLTAIGVTGTGTEGQKYEGEIVANCQTHATVLADASAADERIVWEVRTDDKPVRIGVSEGE
tara:strand:+ start:4222 stop:4983 length:762 start_codon:yes stop_codon:yes gene_type:complete